MGHQVHLELQDLQAQRFQELQGVQALGVPLEVVEPLRLELPLVLVGLQALGVPLEVVEPLQLE